MWFKVYRYSKGRKLQRFKKKKNFFAYAVAIRTIEISNALLRPRVSPILPRRIPPMGRMRKAPPNTANASSVPSPFVTRMDDDDDEGVVKEVVALVVVTLLMAVAVVSTKNNLPKVEAKKP